MKYLITGGTGFIGGNLARKLLESGIQRVQQGLPLLKVYVTGLEKENTPIGSIYLGQNFADIDWQMLGAVDAVFHLAANNDTTETDKDKMFETNVNNSKKLFENAYKAGCRKIVYASSTAVYGNLPAPQKENGGIQPLNVYALSKVALDEYAMDFAKNHPDMIIVGLRYCNVYGPGEREKGKRATMIYQLAQQILKGNPKIFKNGEQKRDYIYVKDVVRANLLALQATESEIYNCGFGQTTTFNNLVKILGEVLGKKREIEYIENPYIKSYQNYTECDMTLAKEKLGFVPEFDISKGIKDYYQSGFLV